MDRLLKWEQLMLVQQLNCVCNTMAKRSITLAINHGYHGRQSQFLPKKDVALVIWGDKVTGDILPPLRFHASKEVARKHLATCKKDMWSNKCFDMVDWEHLDLALKDKTSYGSPSNIWVFVVQGFKSAGTLANCFQTNSAPTVENRRQ
jgi:hypothetical protein